MCEWVYACTYTSYFFHNYGLPLCKQVCGHACILSTTLHLHIYSYNHNGDSKMALNKSCVYRKGPHHACFCMFWFSISWPSNNNLHLSIKHQIPRDITIQRWTKITPIHKTLVWTNVEELNTSLISMYLRGMYVFLLIIIVENLITCIQHCPQSICMTLKKATTFAFFLAYSNPTYKLFNIFARKFPKFALTVLYVI